MRQFRIRIQDVAALRQSDSLYVDKTRPIYDLLQTSTFLFLARSRCFGKSLLIPCQQIKEKRYDWPYRNSGKRIVLLGIAFDANTRNITDWTTESLP